MSIHLTVRSTKQADKQAAKLSQKVLLLLRFLIEDLQNNGPAVPDWPNYGKLKGKKTLDKRIVTCRKVIQLMCVVGN